MWIKVTTWLAAITIGVCTGGTCVRAESPHVSRMFPNSNWRSPTLDDDNYLTWHRFIWPVDSELAWQKVRWHVELADAQVEARRLQRPILLWTMNGHPCGET